MRAELADQFLRIGFAAVGDKEVALSREDVLDRREAVRDHGCRRCAVARRHAAEIERLFDVFLVAHPAGYAGGLLGGIGEHMAHLIGIEPRQRAGGGGGAEHRAEAVGRMAVLAKFIGVQGQGEAAADVVAERDRAQELIALRMLAFAHRPRCGHDAASRVNERRRVRIVGLVGVREHAIDECRIDRVRQKAAADYGGLLRAAERFARTRSPCDPAAGAIPIPSRPAYRARDAWFFR